MADINRIIRTVRRLVNDPNPPDDISLSIVYTDSVYIDAVNFGLDKLNLDLRNVNEFGTNPPWTISSLPSELTFLIIKLAAILMAQTRMTESTDKDNGGDGSIAEIDVPNLRVKEAVNTDLSGSGKWSELADKLQDEYDGEIDRIVPDTPPFLGTATSSTVQRFNYATKSMSKYSLDVNPDSTTLSISYTLGVVSFSWAAVYFDSFLKYEIYLDDVKVVTEYDNHTESISVSQTLSVGNHTANIRVYNGNFLYSTSADTTLSVV